MLPQVLQERILCLTTSCPPPDPLEEEEVWPDWVRPVLCVSIVIVAIAFIAFMKFGQSWFEGSITVIAGLLVVDNTSVVERGCNVPIFSVTGRQREANPCPERCGGCGAGDRGPAVGPAEDRPAAASRHEVLLHPQLPAAGQGPGRPGPQVGAEAGLEDGLQAGVEAGLPGQGLQPCHPHQTRIPRTENWILQINSDPYAIKLSHPVFYGKSKKDKSVPEA